MAKKKTNLKNALRYYQLNPDQDFAVRRIRDNKITILTGAAGSAKTFTSVYAAMQMLADRDISNVVLTRPMVTTEKMGFLPGGVDEKIFPYLEPLMTFFNKFGEVGEKTFDTLLVSGKVKCTPLALMRGTTVENGVLILDESQNTTPEQMLMVLTRLGRDSKIIINGDERQSDTGLKETGLGKLLRAAKVLPFIEHVHLTENMRDEAVTDIIEAWDGLAPKTT